MKTFLLTLLILSYFNYYSLAQALPTISNSGISSIDNYLKEQSTSKQIPGVAAIVANKKHIMYKNAFGMNSIKSNSALNIDAIFAIASMTKAVTAVAVMQLYEQGRIDR